MLFFSSAYAAQSLEETCDYVLMKRFFFPEMPNTRTEK